MFAVVVKKMIQLIEEDRKTRKRVQRIENKIKMVKRGPDLKTILIPDA